MTASFHRSTTLNTQTCYSQSKTVYDNDHLDMSDGMQEHDGPPTIFELLAGGMRTKICELQQMRICWSLQPQLLSFGMPFLLTRCSASSTCTLYRTARGKTVRYSTQLQYKSTCTMLYHRSDFPTVPGTVS